MLKPRPIDYEIVRKAKQQLAKNQPPPATSSPKKEVVKEPEMPVIYPSPTPEQMLAMGWSIIPCGPDKRALVAWKEYQTRQPTLEEVTEWEFVHPPRWSLVTGQFGGRIVLDFDGKEGIATMQWLGLVPHRQTPSGGYHVDFNYPGYYVPTMNGKSKKELAAKYPGMDIRGDGGYAVVTGQGYQWLRDPADSLEAVPIDLSWLDAQPKPKPNGNRVLRYEQQRIDAQRLIDMALERLAYSGRNDAGFALALQLRDNGYSQMEALTVMEDYAAYCPRTNTKGDDEPYTSDEIRATLEQAYRRPARDPWGTGQTSTHHAESSGPHTESTQRTPPNRGAPIAPTLQPAALYGLAGDIVGAILPCSEANDATLLLHLLVGYGNLVGRSAYYLVESTRHYTNLFYAAVGNSSKGRKGTGWDRIRHVLATTDKNWTTKCISSGLSSGEGLIAAVADRDGEKTDKRLLMRQTEFASVLRVMQRDGNTLSAVLRDAFDNGWLSTLTKRDPLHVENAHISVITHITRDELKRSLSETEVSNGFANRFLWAWSHRSKYLPEGGEINQQVMTELVERLCEAVDAGKVVEQMKRDEPARAWWDAEYKPLSDGVPGLLGEVTNRGEVMVMRLSMIYALLDCTSVIGERHLIAAKAVWDYCFNSAKYVFGAALGYPLADTIWNALQAAQDKGLSRTQIFKVLGNNPKASQISNALLFLEERGLAHREEVGEGRNSMEVWYVGARSETA